MGQRPAHHVFKKTETYSKFRPSEPYFDTYQQIVVPDAHRTAGRVHLRPDADARDADARAALHTVRKAKPDANLYTWVDRNWQHIRPSVEYAPFKDFRVRKALFLARDYKAMADGYYGDGLGVPGRAQPRLPGGVGPDKVKTLPGYNPDTKAKTRRGAASC